MSAQTALGSGLAGACALTLLHETARRTVPNAPRMDILGMRSISRLMQAAGQSPPREKRLHQWALAGDLAANSAFYSLVAAGGPQGALTRGALLGLAAGIGAVALPGRLGLGSAPSSGTKSTALMTIGWYFAGGLAAAIVYRLLEPRN